MHTVKHLNINSGELASRTFDTWEQMELYIDLSILPMWEEGDYILCDGNRRECFDNYHKTD